MKVVVAEDDPQIAGILEANLKHADFETVILNDGHQVVSFFENQSADFVLLDIMMPKLDGYEVFRRVKAISDVPVIMISAKVSEEDRIKGLELGVDDYICKPFSPREVVARIKTVNRRCNASQLRKESENTTHGSFQIDESSQTILYDGAALTLTNSEYNLLNAMLSRPNHIFGRDALLTVLRNHGEESTDRAIDSHIKNLRKKLRVVDPDSNPIKSVYGVGYKLN